jgi:hypothetical protein
MRRRCLRVPAPDRKRSDIPDRIHTVRHAPLMFVDRRRIGRVNPAAIDQYQRVTSAVHAQWCEEIGSGRTVVESIYQYELAREVVRAAQVNAPVHTLAAVGPE